MTISAYFDTARRDMLRMPIFFVFLMLGGVVLAQYTNKNYILNKTYKTATSSPIQVPNAAQATMEITYFDGLGRPKQQIAYGQSGSGGDLITHIEYDPFGRQVKQYLPYERTGMSLDFDAQAQTNVQSFYNSSYFQNTANPYSETEIEHSALNRPLRQAAPGNPWAMDGGHEITMDYHTNNSEEVYYFMVSSSGSLALNSSNQGYYPADRLYKNEVTDENGHFSITYTNALGQVVAKAIQLPEREGNDLNIGYTYYVYDLHGNLVYVLPPKLSDVIVSNGSLASNHHQLFNELGYRYRYDHRNRLVRKRLHGMNREWNVYYV